MSFQKLSLDSLRRIRPLLQNKFPKSAMMLNIFDIALSGKYPDDEDNVQIYGYNGVPDEDSMFLDANFKESEDARFSVIFAPEVVTDDMINAFSQLQYWSMVHEYNAPMHVTQLLENLVMGKGGSLSKGQGASDMYLPIQSALELNLERGEDLRENFELGELSPEHATKVNAHWKYGGEPYNRIIADAIRGFRGPGIFRKKTGATENTGKSSDELVSWTILMRCGTLNCLHTLDEYRGKGLGRWTMEAASKRVAQEGLVPLCQIEPYNKQSKSLMEKIGYKFIHETWWIKYTPPTTPSSINTHN